MDQRSFFWDFSTIMLADIYGENLENLIEVENYK